MEHPSVRAGGGAIMVTFGGRDWFYDEFVICLGLDACAMAMGNEPQNFTRSEIMACLNEICSAPLPAPKAGEPR